MSLFFACAFDLFCSFEGLSGLMTSPRPRFLMDRASRCCSSLLFFCRLQRHKKTSLCWVSLVLAKAVVLWSHGALLLHDSYGSFKKDEEDEEEEARAGKDRTQDHLSFSAERSTN